MLNNDIEDLNKAHNFLAYKGTSDSNVLFLGSCRMTPIMYYLNTLCPQYNLYCIYCPFWGNQFEQNNGFPKEKIDLILPKAELFITETIRNYKILNTDRCSSENFFSSFDASHLKEIRLSNLELRMYFYDLINTYKHKIEDVDSVFLESKKRLDESLAKYGFPEITSFINNNFTKTKLFSTHNHPCRILSLAMFKNIANRLNLKVTFDFLKNVSLKNFLEQNSSPITKSDIKKYKFEFYTQLFDEDILNNPSFYYSPSEEENTKLDQFIEQIL
jgi:hypothetical protein